MTANDIPMLTEAEHSDLQDRIHECGARFKRLNSSPLWAIESFSVSDVMGELTPRQRSWLSPFIGFMLRIDNEADVMKLQIELPDSDAEPNEIYTLVGHHDIIKKEAYDAPASQPAMISLVTKRLAFSKRSVAA